MHFTLPVVLVVVLLQAENRQSDGNNPSSETRNTGGSGQSTGGGWSTYDLPVSFKDSVTIAKFDHSDRQVRSDSLLYRAERDQRAPWPLVLAWILVALGGYLLVEAARVQRLAFGSGEPPARKAHESGVWLGFFVASMVCLGTSAWWLLQTNIALGDAALLVMLQPDRVLAIPLLTASPLAAIALYKFLLVGTLSAMAHPEDKRTAAISVVGAFISLVTVLASVATLIMFVDQYAI